MASLCQKIAQEIITIHELGSSDLWETYRRFNPQGDDAWPSVTCFEPHEYVTRALREKIARLNSHAIGRLLYGARKDDLVLRLFESTKLEPAESSVGHVLVNLVGAVLMAELQRQLPSGRHDEVPFTAAELNR